MVLVEDIPLDKRTKMVVASFHFSTGKVEPLFSLGHHHRYVQGCAVKGNDFVITANDGGSSATTRFIVYGLEEGKILSDVTFQGFGESEGLYVSGEGWLVTGRNLREGNSAVYRLMAGRSGNDGSNTNH